MTRFCQTRFPLSRRDGSAAQETLSPQATASQQRIQPRSGACAVWLPAWCSHTVADDLDPHGGGPRFCPQRGAPQRGERGGRRSGCCFPLWWKRCFAPGSSLFAWTATLFKRGKGGSEAGGASEMPAGKKDRVWQRSLAAPLRERERADSQQEPCLYWLLSAFLWEEDTGVGAHPAQRMERGEWRSCWDVPRCWKRCSAPLSPPRSCNTPTSPVSAWISCGAIANTCSSGRRAWLCSPWS